MSDDRPAVPAQLKRDLMEEAGYRCAIQTCKGTDALEMAHIVPWSQVREHSFENMIVLCAVDHHRYDTGRIPRKSIEAFKANLGLLRGRYSDAERRILEAFAANAPFLLDKIELPIPGGMRYTVMYLVRDGLIEVESKSGVIISGLPAHETVFLTEKGIQVVRRMQEAQKIEETTESIE